MKQLNFFLLAIVAMSIVSCSSYRGMQNPPSLVKFEKEDFEFSKQVSGKARTVYFLGIDWANLFNKKVGDFSNSIISSSAIPYVDKTANKAVYKILENNPGYDVLFYPSIEKTKKWYFLISVTEATVKTRLAKIKSTEGGDSYKTTSQTFPERSERKEMSQQESVDDISGSFSGYSQPVIGEIEYRKYLEKNIRRSVISNCSQQGGKVTVKFRIDQTGRPKDIWIRKSLCQSADNEAKRIVMDGPKWTLSKEEVTLDIIF